MVDIKDIITDNLIEATNEISKNITTKIEQALAPLFWREPLNQLMEILYQSEPITREIPESQEHKDTAFFDEIYLVKKLNKRKEPPYLIAPNSFNDLITNQEENNCQK